MYLQNHPTAPVKITIPCGSLQKEFVAETEPYNDTASGNWVEFQAPRGEKGEQGERGVRGATGTAGKQGEKGTQGLQGIQGDKRCKVQVVLMEKMVKKVIREIRVLKAIVVYRYKRRYWCRLER